MEQQTQEGQGRTGTAAFHGAAKPGQGDIWDNRNHGYVSRGAANSPSSATTASPAIPPSRLLHTTAPEPGHLEDAQREQLHHHNGSSGTCSRHAPLTGAGTPFLQMLSTAFSASSAAPEPVRGDSSLASDASRPSIPTPPRVWFSHAKPVTRGTRLHKPLPKYKCHRSKECPIAFGFHIDCFKLFICICNSSTYSNMPSRNHMVNFHVLIFQQR